MTGHGPVDRAAVAAEMQREATARYVSVDIVRWQRRTRSRTALQRYAVSAAGVYDAVREAYATEMTIEEIVADSGLDQAVVVAWIAGQAPRASGTIGS